jgi:hypothetical protein
MSKSEMERALEADGEKLRQLTGEDHGPWTVFHCIPINTCAHEWGGWRDFEDGRGGEQVCKKCGLGAMANSLAQDW